MAPAFSLSSCVCPGGRKAYLAFVLKDRDSRMLIIKAAVKPGHDVAVDQRMARWDG
jgi:hypothetical protein